MESNLLSEVRNNWYKTSKEEAIKQLEKILLNNGVKQDKIFKYYFEKIANDSLVEYSKWTVNELLQSDELLSMFIRKSQSNDKVFTSSDLTQNVRTAIRLGGKGYARPVTQFPLKENIRLINVKNSIVGDMACGWGTRMIAAAATGNNYIGFEVNEPLIEKLNELGNDIKNILPGFNFKIFGHGSEVVEHKVIGKLGQIITSPPYFDLEQYTQHGDEVYSQSYSNFLNSFLLPVVDNALSYVSHGDVLINIKDTKSSSSMTDIVKYVSDKHLNYEFGELKNIQRTLSNGTHLNNNEDILIIHK